MSRPGAHRSFPNRGIRALAMAALCLIGVPQAGFAAPRQEDQALTISVADVVEMLESGISEDDILAAFRGLPPLALTIDDIGRLKKAGATDRLIREISKVPSTRTTPPAPGAEAAPPVPLPPPVPPPSGSLRINKVLWWERSGVPIEEIAARIDDKGLKQSVEFDTLLGLCEEQDASSEFALLLAQGGSSPPPRLAALRRSPGRPAAAPMRGTAGLKPADVLRMLEEGRTPAAVTGVVIARGMATDLQEGEEAALRAAGANDDLIALMHDSAPVPDRPPAAATPAPEAAEAAHGTPEEAGPRRLPAIRRDSLLVSSVPTGASVYVAPASTAPDELFSRPYLAGRTPLSLSVAPGRYTVVVRKEAGNFEAEMIPAWRTIHDLESRRILLDNADLTFSPASCCLPGALDGRVVLRPLDPSRGGLPLGDRFGGLPPYLIDGESLQILSVAGTAVVGASKLYTIVKETESPALVTATFFPADAPPLNREQMEEELPGTPFDAFLDAPSLSFLGQPSQVESLAAALDLAPGETAAAVEMLRRAGKAIVTRPAPGGRRFVVLAVTGHDGIHLEDRTIVPQDPFAAPEPARKGRGRKRAASPPPPPSLPDMQRLVVPGLGKPRLVVNNTRPADALLMFDDGHVFFVPANTEREFVLTPGTYRVRVAGPGFKTPLPEGALHFSYQARYTITF